MIKNIQQIILTGGIPEHRAPCYRCEISLGKLSLASRWREGHVVLWVNSDRCRSIGSQREISYLCLSQSTSPTNQALLVTSLL